MSANQITIFDTTLRDGEQRLVLTVRHWLLVGVFLLLGLSMHVNAYAAQKDCIESYHISKDFGCIEQTLQGLETNPSRLKPDAKSGLHKTIQPVVGLLAYVFKDNPDAKASILKADHSIQMKALFLEALYRAGLSGEAQSYAQQNDLEAFNRAYVQMNLAPIEQVQVKANPADNDLLIGAYFASGKAQYLLQILDNFKTAVPAMVSDALRTALMQSKFGPQLAPPANIRPQHGQMAKASCLKYDCQQDIQSFMHMMTLSSAHWALTSLARKYKTVAETVQKFWQADPERHMILNKEMANFSNYLTLLATQAAKIKNPNMERYLMAYETLQPVDVDWIKDMKGNE